MGDPDFHALTAYFKALSDGFRLEMLAALSEMGETNVSRLAKTLEASQPLVSWHLRPLARAGLVRLRKSGRETYCSLNPDAFLLYRDAMSRLLSSEVGGSGEGAA